MRSIASSIIRITRALKLPPLLLAPSWAGPVVAVGVVFGMFAWLDARSEPVPERRLDGFNVIAAAAHPFGSPSANLALTNANRLGAAAIAVIPFLWQSSRVSPNIARGDDMDDDELRAAIRQAHALGLAVLIKPHVWVPESWAGAVIMRSDEDWQEWFANYQRELLHIAQIAEAEKAEALAIGTELSQTTLWPHWINVIDKTRVVFSGHLLYIAHNVEEAETVPFWDRLDAIGVSLYPPLGGDNDRDYRRETMRKVADRIDAVAAVNRKPVIVGEIGLRCRGSARAGATPQSGGNLPPLADEHCLPAMPPQLL